MTTITDHLPIDVQGLRKTYGDFAAVDHLDLQVRPGEVFALLGPNGAGKTTTVDMLCGVQRRTAGTVSVLGEDPHRDSRQWRNRLGVVPQNTGDYLNLTVREVVEMFATFYSDPIPTDELISMVGLTAKAGAKTNALSGGQKRRLDVAVGVVGKPELIFLDEPTTGLDPQARREAWDLVDYFRELGATTVLTTHYLDEAETLADRAGVIAAGRMLAIGTIDELGRTAGYSANVTVTDLEGVAGVIPPDLGALEPDARADRRGGVLIGTDQPTAVVERLTRLAREQGFGEIPGLTVSRPTLEDTYLRLIQREDAQR